MNTFELQAQPRTVSGKKVKALRQNGRIPGVIYGREVESRLVDVDAKDLQKLIQQAGTAGLLELTIGGTESVHVLISDAQADHLGTIRHVDFHAVKMDEVVRTEVPLRLVGDVPAVYNLGGSLVQVLEELEVEALPANLPQHIDVDVSVLEELESHISVESLKAPDKVTILTDPHEMVCKVESPRSDEEMAALDEEMGEAVAAEGSVEGEAAEADQANGADASDKDK